LFCIFQNSNPPKTIKHIGFSLMACLMAALLFSAAARATENGGSVYPVGAETVLQGTMPGPHETRAATFTLLITANEFDDSNGHAVQMDFKARIFGNAVKVEHNWGIPVFGGMLESTVAVPVLYEQVREGADYAHSEKLTQFGLSNCMIVPLGVAYHKGHWNGFYQVDFYPPAAPYSTATGKLNVGQHHTALSPVGAFTYLSDKDTWEVSSKVDYIFNFTDNNPAPAGSATSYRNGNELTWEYTAMRAVSKKAAIGFNGYLYQQTTNDQCTGAGCTVTGSGRDLAVGPEMRVFFGKHSAFAVKYFRDTLVENKPRGNGFWFETGFPLNFGKKK
jgi:hypothetical protein